MTSQDGVLNAIHRGRLYWFYGDTNRLSYALGNFAMAGATTDLPDRVDPAVGIDLTIEAGIVRRKGERAVQLTLFACARSFGAAVALGELFYPAGCVHELLFAGEKRMTSSADTDSNVAAGRAGTIYRAARAHHFGLVIFWVNVCFHVRK